MYRKMLQYSCYIAECAFPRSYFDTCSVDKIYSYRVVVNIERLIMSCGNFWMSSWNKLWLIFLLRAFLLNIKICERFSSDTNFVSFFPHVQFLSAFSWYKPFVSVFIIIYKCCQLSPHILIVWAYVFSHITILWAFSSNTNFVSVFVIHKFCQRFSNIHIFFFVFSDANFPHVQLLWAFFLMYNFCERFSFY